MITVIIPTMWKGSEINKMLPQLSEHPLVGEIILIDNDPAVKNEQTCALPKVNYVTFGKNIFPVPSWNYGWENAKYDKLMIINDDVMFDPIIVDAMDNFITDKIGTITMCNQFVSGPLDGDTSNIPRVGLESVSIVHCDKLKHRAAVILGIHKNVYHKIPEELLIHYNDYFLFKFCESREQQNFSMVGATAKTIMSTTVKHFPDITRHESKIYRELFANYGISNA